MEPKDPCNSYNTFVVGWVRCHGGALYMIFIIK